MTADKLLIVCICVISTHTPLAGRDTVVRKKLVCICISTHTPLAGRDFGNSPARTKRKRFQLTRPLRGVTLLKVWTMSPTTFQLTRPLRGVTVLLLIISAYLQISTHTPLAGRDGCFFMRRKKLPISTHTPLAGRDIAPSAVPMMPVVFQLTRPLRGVTQNLWPNRPFNLISTHTPLAGRDFNGCPLSAYLPAFQLTRPLRGVTLMVARYPHTYQHFNSHAPCGA